VAQHLTAEDLLQTCPSYSNNERAITLEQPMTPSGDAWNLELTASFLKLQRTQRRRNMVQQHLCQSDKAKVTWFSLNWNVVIEHF
jgi:hypothetical protein